MEHLCFFCDQEIDLNDDGNIKDASLVRTHGIGSFTSTISAVAKQRGDPWGVHISGKLAYYNNDLHAHDVEYHHICSINFRTNKSVPTKYIKESASTPKRPMKGRPVDTMVEEAFNNLCSYFDENDEGLCTIADLQNKMLEFGAQYSKKHLLRRLMDFYGDSLVTISETGKETIITRRERQDTIIRECFEAGVGSTSYMEKKKAILDAAVRLLKSDIKQHVPNIGDEYPDIQDLTLESMINYLPESVTSFCRSLFVGRDTDRKVAAIGQALVQAVRPVASMSPLQMALGVEIHHLTRSSKHR